MFFFGYGCNLGRDVLLAVCATVGATSSEGFLHAVYRARDIGMLTHRTAADRQECLGHDLPVL